MHGHAEITNLDSIEVHHTAGRAPRSLSIRGRFDLRRSPTGPLSAWPLFLSPRAPGTPSRARIATTFPQQATRLQVNTRTGKTTPTTKKDGVHVIFVTALEHMRFLPYKHPRAEKRARARMCVRLPAGLLGDGANHKGKLTTSRNRLTLSWVHRS